MAVYKNREVSVIGYLGSDDFTVEILHKNGDREQVNLSQVQFTKDETKDLEKWNANAVGRVSTIEDKDLKELRDSQDPEKIAEKQEKENTDKDVPVRQIKVNADEVAKAKRV